MENEGPRKRTLSPKRRRQFRLIGAGIAIVFAFLAFEIGLRASGRGPWAPNPPLPNHPPAMLEPAPQIGWANKAGEFRYPAYVPGLPEIKMTFWPGGFRVTGPEQKTRPRKIVIVGGSCMQASALSDEETFGWKLQDRLPQVEVVNAGVGAYGTYQSLLRLERMAETWKQAPDVVIYGFPTFHGIRNVAHHTWLANLIKGKEGGHAETPYCLAEDGKLVRYPPEGYADWPLNDSLATVATLEKAWMRFASRGRRDMQLEVTTLLLKEMNELCKRHGATLLIMEIGTHPKLTPSYDAFFEREGIPFVDVSKNFIDPDHQVPGEGHPNGRMNLLWTEAIVPIVEELLALEKSE